MAADSRPNIIFIMADDHASKSISCYGAGINHTPNIDKLAKEGMKFNHCYVTNSICTPSRASILTGTYNHVNGVMTLDNHVCGPQYLDPITSTFILSNDVSSIVETDIGFV